MMRYTASVFSDVQKSLEEQGFDGKACQALSST